MEIFPGSCVTIMSMAPPIGLYFTALLTRLSMASRIRSESTIAVCWEGAETLMVCCLRAASGRFASATSCARIEMSTGSPVEGPCLRNQLLEDFSPTEDHAQGVLQVVGDSAEDLALEAVGLAQPR